MRQSIYNIHRGYQEARDDLRREEMERCHQVDRWTFVISIIFTISLILGAMVIDPLNSGLF